MEIVSVARWTVVLSVLLLACSSPTPHRKPDPIDSTDTTPEDTDSEPGDTTSSDTTSSEVCRSLPPMPALGTAVEGFVPGEYTAVHEDFTFSPEGRLTGVHAYDGFLQASTVDGEVTRLVPGFAQNTKGITWLPDGRVAIVDPNIGAVRLVDPETGGQEIVGGGLSNPNGIARGPDDDLFVTALGLVVRIDETGQIETIVELPGYDLDGIAFSPDFGTLYVDQPSGPVFASTRGDDGTWTPLEPFASVPLSQRGLVYDVADGMVTDLCGNLYVVGMRGLLVRFTPDGQLDGITAIAGAQYELLSAVRFGPGAGGFDADTAYVTGLLGTVSSVYIGVGGMPR